MFNFSQTVSNTAVPSFMVKLHKRIDSQFRQMESLKKKQLVAASSKAFNKSKELAELPSGRTCWITELSSVDEEWNAGLDAHPIPVRNQNNILRKASPHKVHSFVNSSASERKLNVMSPPLVTQKPSNKVCPTTPKSKRNKTKEKDSMLPAKQRPRLLPSSIPIRAQYCRLDLVISIAKDHGSLSDHLDPLSLFMMSRTSKFFRRIAKDVAAMRMRQAHFSVRLASVRESTPGFFSANAYGYNVAGNFLEGSTAQGNAAERIRLEPKSEEGCQLQSSVNFSSPSFVWDRRKKQPCSLRVYWDPAPDDCVFYELDETYNDLNGALWRESTPDLAVLIGEVCIDDEESFDGTRTRTTECMGCESCGARLDCADIYRGGILPEIQVEFEIREDDTHEPSTFRQCNESNDCHHNNHSKPLIGRIRNIKLDFSILIRVQAAFHASRIHNQYARFKHFSALSIDGLTPEMTTQNISENQKKYLAELHHALTNAQFRLLKNHFWGYNMFNWLARYPKTNWWLENE